MSRLSDEQYAEYVKLLKAWVEADKTLKGLQSPDAGARERATQAYTAVERFRADHGLERKERQTPTAVEGSAREAGAGEGGVSNVRS